MNIFSSIFIFLRKIYNFLKTKYFILSVAGWILIFLIVISTGFQMIFKYTTIKIFEIISLKTFKLILIYFIFLIPLSNDKLKQTLKNISHRSYLYFFFFSGLILFGIIYIMIPNNCNFVEIFINNSINIMITLYGILTIFWFAYHIIYSNNINLLRKQLQLYIFIITIIQLFLINKYSKFEYCISVLILTYTFIQYLFEDKSNEKKDSITQ